MEKTKIYASKDYEAFVIESIVKQLSKAYKIKKKNARVLFFNALAKDLVVEQIIISADFILERLKEEAIVDLKNEWGIKNAQE